MIISLVNITPNLFQEDIKHPPLGLLYVGGNLKRGGYPVRVYHILPEEIEQAAQAIVKEAPLFVGFSVLTGIPTSLSAQMSKRIKALVPQIPIVWGGHHPTLSAQQCLKEDYVDIVVLGEGEETVVELAQALEGKRDLRTVLGIAHKKHGEVVFNPPRPRIKNIDTSELDWDLVNMQNYIIQSGTERVIGFYSSRGCPYNCGFCSSTKFFERTWRAHSVDYVVKSLKRLKAKYGINGVFFSDDNFIIDKQRAFDIIRGLLNNGIRVKTLDIRIDHLNQETLSFLREHQATGLFIGWESGCNRLLKLMRKGITKEQIMEKAKLLAQYPEISVWASGIIGLPTETEEETRQTIETGLEMFKIHPNMVVSFQIYLPFPGTDLLPLAVEQGFKLPRSTEDWQGVDVQGETKDKSWLPWLSPKRQKKMWFTNRYSRSALRKYYSAGLLIKIIGGFFSFLAFQRIKHQQFFLPFDLAFFKFLKKWRQRNKTLMVRESFA